MPRIQIYMGASYSPSLESLPKGRPSNSLHYAVGEISGKLDQVISSLLPQLQTMKDDHSSLEVRVVSLERGQWLVVGGGTVIVFLITAWEVIRVFIL